MRAEERAARDAAYKADRAQGMTYREIAEKHGTTYQSVYYAIGPAGNRAWHPFSRKQCKFKGWREWMNKNNISVSRLSRMMGLAMAASTTNRIRAFMCGRIDPPKRTIDMLLHLSGLTYEQFFEEG